MTIELAAALAVALKPNRWWGGVTALGDSAVLLPCATFMFFWLYAERSSRNMAYRWLVLLSTVGLLVLLSKLIFIAWGIGIDALNFTGLSGHSALSAVVWPLALALIVGAEGQRYRAGGALIGLVLALLIAISRVVLSAHSLSEAMLGSLLGVVCTLAFLFRYGSEWRAEKWRLPAVLSLALALSLTYGLRFPSTFLLEQIGSHLNMTDTIHRRQQLP